MARRFDSMALEIASSAGSEIFNSTTGSVVCWGRNTFDSDDAVPQFRVIYAETGVSDGSWVVFSVTHSGTSPNVVWNLQLDGKGSPQTFALTGSTDLADDRSWHHYGLVRRDGGSWELYVDGVSDASGGQNNGTAAKKKVSIGSHWRDIVPPTDHFNLWGESTGTNRDGDLAHLMRFNRALTTQEVNNCMDHPGRCIDGVDGYWKLGMTIGGDLDDDLDVSGKGLHGTVNDFSTGVAERVGNPPVGPTFGFNPMVTGGEAVVAAPRRVIIVDYGREAARRAARV